MKNFFDHDTAKAVYYVYLYGGVTKAGEKLFLSQSAMSRRIQTAEERAGLQIFERDYHYFTPTKEGLRYIEACKQILHIGDAALKDAHAMIGSGRNEIRILGTPSMTDTWLPIALENFSRKYPDLRVIIKSDVRTLDILGTDILISPYFIENEDLVKVKLFEQTQGLFASTGYLEQFGVPKSEEDLDRHRLLAIDQEKYGLHANANWHLSYGMPSSKKLRAPSMELASNDGRYRAMLSGHGIAPVSIQYHSISKSKSVIRVLPQIRSERMGLYLFYNRHQLNSEKCEILRNFIQEHIARNQAHYNKSD